jgi:hypothetical protein
MAQADSLEGAADCGVEARTAPKFTKAQKQVLLFFSARCRGRADSRRRPDALTMVSHLKVNWRQGAYRPAHPPGAPSAAVRDRPALCSLSQGRSQSVGPAARGLPPRLTRFRPSLPTAHYRRRRPLLPMQRLMRSVQSRRVRSKRRREAAHFLGAARGALSESRYWDQEVIPSCL